MHYTRFLVFMFVASLAIIACPAREEEAPPTATTTEMPGTTSPSDVSPVSAQTWIDDVTIGHELAADGSLTAGRTGDDFAPGQPIHIAMTVADAPPNSAVKVVWYAPGEKIIAEESKTTASGQRFMNFTAGNTSSWAKGDYRAEVWVGDEKVNTQQFQIVDRAKAGK